MKRILIVNGSLRGIDGNSFQIAQKAKKMIEEHSDFESLVLNLAETQDWSFDPLAFLENYDAFLVVTGTYWSNIGSLLQRFAEICTSLENSKSFFGKPFASVVTMDSVGGLQVLGQIQLIFSGLGCWMPPCSQMAISRVSEQLVAKSEEDNIDVWRLDDLKIVVENLLKATSISVKWSVWEIEQLFVKTENLNNHNKLLSNNIRFIN
ncbi:MAG: NAD(P)H-dependent oxidoreductase [Cytophagales bacterium]